MDGPTINATDWGDYLRRRPQRALVDVTRSLIAPLYDPWCVFAAVPAGFLARACIVPFVGFDHTLRCNVTATNVCVRRSAYFAALSLAYFPVHRVAQWDHNDHAYDRFLRLCLCGFWAGAVSRIATNPLFRSQIIAVQHGMPLSAAARYIFRSDFGAAGFWITEHPIIPNALYIMTFFVILEAIRRRLDYAGLCPDNLVGRAAFHGGCAGLAAGAASSLTYNFSAKQYTGVVVRPSAVTAGRVPLLKKEVPLMAGFFFWFSLFQPFVSPAHENCGLGA